jgi:hypothetical protein
MVRTCVSKTKNASKYKELFIFVNALLDRSGLQQSTKMQALNSKEQNAVGTSSFLLFINKMEKKSEKNLPLIFIFRNGAFYLCTPEKCLSKTGSTIDDYEAS